MGKYPAYITEEENSKLKYPFLPVGQYDEIHHLSDGPTILIRYSKENFSKSDIAHIVKINRNIAERRILNEKEKASSCK